MTECATQTTIEGALRLSIDEPMTIYGAGELKRQIMGAVRSSSDIEIDLSHVAEMDTAGFQLLVMARQESRRLGHTLRLSAPSPAVREVLDFYNMDAFFGDSMTLPTEY